MNRRFFLGIAASLEPSSALVLDGMPVLAKGVDVNAVLNDPEAPTGGNPKGDVTIVAFFDYNCPYCKTSAADLARVVKEDGKIRLVYKDWPILTESSVQGAQFALAANYRGKYETAHHALMGISGRGVTGDTMLSGNPCSARRHEAAAGGSHRAWAEDLGADAAQSGAGRRSRHERHADLSDRPLPGLDARP